MRTLIVGAGPAGLAFAALLLEQGIVPDIVEKSAESRTEGYAVGLHVNGWNVAQRMGLLEAFQAQAVPLAEAEYRSPAGKRLFSYNYRGLANATGGKMLAIMRDALLSVLLDAVKGMVRIDHGVSVAALVDDGDGVDVTLSSGERRRYDIVVGADGYRSGVRQIVFGEHSTFLKPLGYRAAAWRMPLARQLESSFIGMMDVDLQGGLYAVGDGTAATLFCWRDASTERMPPAERDAVLRARFSGWAEPVAGALADEIDWSRGFFDTISQVEMPGWSKGRVVLLGDAAWCMTFLSGQGTSTAFAGAWILSQELARKPHDAAFASYEARLRPTVSKMQAASRRIGGHYVPQSRFGMWMQSKTLPLLLSPIFSGLLARRILADELDLDAS